MQNKQNLSKSMNKATQIIAPEIKEYFTAGNKSIMLIMLKGNIINYTTLAEIMRYIEIHNFKKFILTIAKGEQALIEVRKDY